jgi:hypothetical protein
MSNIGKSERREIEDRSLWVRYVKDKLVEVE